MPRETSLLADALVIGNEPQQAISAYLDPTDRETAGGGVAAHAVTADPSVDKREATVSHAPDAFLLPQDHDGRATSHPSTLDLPEFDASMPPVRGGPGGTTAAPPAEVPAVAARRIRDAVIDDLRARIDTELDARIAQALHVEVESVLAQLQHNLRAHLSDALRDVVAKAVDEAIAGRGDGGAPTA